MKEWQREVNALVRAGHAPDYNEGRSLRNRILTEGSTVDQWLEAKSQPTVFGASPSGVEEMSDISALMSSEGVSFGHAKLLRSQIVEAGRTVREFILDAAQGGNAGLPNTLDLFRRAGELIKIAGSKERAIQALESYESLEQ